MKECYVCGGRMEKVIEMITIRDKTTPQEVMKCDSCGKAIVSSDEYERVRKELHPSILNRIKNLFKADTEVVDISKGKVL